MKSRPPTFAAPPTAAQHERVGWHGRRDRQRRHDEGDRRDQDDAHEHDARDRRSRLRRAGWRAPTTALRWRRTGRSRRPRGSAAWALTGAQPVAGASSGRATPSATTRQRSNAGRHTVAAIRSASSGSRVSAAPQIPRPARKPDAPACPAIRTCSTNTLELGAGAEEDPRRARGRGVQFPAGLRRARFTVHARGRAAGNGSLSRSAPSGCSRATASTTSRR